MTFDAKEKRKVFQIRIYLCSNRYDKRIIQKHLSRNEKFWYKL